MSTPPPGHEDELPLDSPDDDAADDAAADAAADTADGAAGEAAPWADGPGHASTDELPPPEEVPPSPS